jgi:hypothetical protein
MQIACPAPATFMRWRDAMTQVGIALPVGVALFVVMVWAARPSPQLLRLACGLCAALALGGAAGAGAGYRDRRRGGARR